FGGGYYLSLGNPEVDRFEQIVRSNMRRMYNLRASAKPQYIRRTLRQHPDATRIIVWEQLDLDPTPDQAADPIGEMLGESWSRVSEEIYHVRFYWTWGDLYDYRRREYERTGTDIPS